MSIAAHSTPSASAPTLAAPSVARTLRALVRRELRDALTSRWFILDTLAFGALAVGVSFMALAGADSYGFAGFAKTAAGLLNLIMLIVPLMAITAGAGAIAGERERGTLLYLLAQPISRLEFLLGKFIGLSIALCAALCLGFGLSGLILAWKAGGAGAGVFLLLVAFTCLLAVTMLALGLLVSVLSRRTSVATGLGVFVWLTLVLLSDLGLMAGAIVFKLRVQELFALAIINPLQAFKMCAILSMNASLDVLGPAGAYASQTYAHALPWILFGVIIAWGVVSLGAAAILFTRRASV